MSAKIVYRCDLCGIDQTEDPDSDFVNIYGVKIVAQEVSLVAASDAKKHVCMDCIDMIAAAFPKQKASS